MPKEIRVRGKLGKGKHIIVSNEDYERCKKIRWHMMHEHVTGKVNGKETPIGNYILGVTSSYTHMVDHWDRNPLNNQRDNLRYCTVGENNRNREKSPRNKTGYKGVTQTKSGKFAAVIYAPIRKRVFLGTFDTAKEAARAYNAACPRIHGTFGRINEGVDDE